MPVNFNDKSITIPKAAEILVAFHGPFLLISRTRGVDVLVPRITNHRFVWGTEPFMVPDPQKPQSLVKPSKVRYKVPATQINAKHEIVALQALQSGPTRPTFDAQKSLCLPPIAPPSTPTAALTALILLPWPDAVFTERERVLEPGEGYQFSAGGVTKHKKKNGSKERTSLLHILKYRGTGPAGTSAVVHFHNEFDNPASALAVNDPRHDLDAFEDVLPGLTITIDDSSVTLSHNPAAKDTFMSHLNSAHWKSLYETGTGTGTVNCDGGTGNC